MAKTETKKTETMIIKGKLIRVKREAKKFKGKLQEEKTHVSLSEVVLTKEQQDNLLEVFKDAGERFTPKWLLELNGYFNCASAYDIPTRNYKGAEYLDILDYVSEHNYYNAECRIAINLKEGAIYPKAIMVDTIGEPINNFGDFD